jgi:acyl-CoA reductase-like NAD-dependent aldehyde dehydrogenase
MAGIEADLAPLRSAAFNVDPEVELAAAVRTAIDGAFGRATTLSGQRTGQIGRAFCPAPLSSAFGAALRAALAQDRAALDPLGSIDARALERARARWTSALVQGATPVFGGPQRARCGARGTCVRACGSHQRRADHGDRARWTTCRSCA